jgi:hypothetical protein
METLKIKISKSVEEIVEIQLPVYRKNECHAYYVYSETEAIKVTDLDKHYSVSQTFSELAFHLESYKDCTREEFMEVYDKVEKILKSKLLL